MFQLDALVIFRAIRAERDVTTSVKVETLIHFLCTPLTDPHQRMHLYNNTLAIIYNIVVKIVKVPLNTHIIVKTYTSPQPMTK